MKNRFYLLLLIFVFSGCNKINSNNQFIEFIEITDNSSLKLSSFIEKIEYVILPKDLILSRIDKVLEFNDLFIICDFDNLSKIFIYNSKNLKIYSIDNFGEGPGEYNYISDVTINEDLNTIDILSLNKILRFDLFGVFKEEIHLNSLLYKMMYIKDNNYIVYIPSNLHGDLLSNELSGSILFNLDPDKNTYKRLLPYYFKNNMPFMSEVNILQKFKDNFFFTMTFADTIYSFNMENFINKKYFLDFKTKRYPIELLYNNDDAISILNDKNNISKYSYHYSNLHINEKYLITNFRAKSNGVIVYNKESKEVFSGYDLINDIDKGLNKFNIKLLRDNIAYSFDQPGYILEHFEKNGNNMTKNRNNFTEMASKVDAHTSLILSKYYLK